MFFSFFFLIYFVFYFFLILLSLMNDNLLVYWLILEVSLMLFLPFILNNKFGFEVSMKYFLVQVFGSFMIIMMFICSLKYLYMFMFILFLKMGVAPFYYWSLYLVEKMEYNSFFFFLSMLKIIPLVILSVSYLKLFGTYMFVFLNCFVGSLGGLGSLCFRKLMFYSSLGHTGWVFSCITISDYVWAEYFFIYVMVFFFIIYIFYSNSMYNINDIKEFNMKNFFIVCLLLSFSGLPPFSIFMMKFYVIFMLLGVDSYLLCFMLIISSLLSLYYYLRVSLDNYIFFNYSKLLNFDAKMGFIYWMIFLVNFFLLEVMIFFYV